VLIYTDGGCDPNPGPGGWAAVLKYGSHRREVSGGEPATTNNRMELRAAIEGLSALKEPCQAVLLTDSQYLQRGVSEWLALWQRNGWRTQDRKAVKNRDLWQNLAALIRKHRVSWHWIRGHAGHLENERCDGLAEAAIATIRRQYRPEELSRFLTEFRSRDRAAGQHATEVAPASSSSLL
jgi:ribonuclease HI